MGMPSDSAKSRPTGTITFLFSDIEGSTVRWERDRAAMASALSRHDALLHAAFEAHGAYIFKTVGDEFCAAFARAEDAVAAALDAQRALANEDFSSIQGLKVRMALHTGTAEERDGDYFGPTVNRVARLLATGYGGQVLVSGSAAAMLHNEMPPQSSLRDLGPQRLKDLVRPEQVYQLVAADLRESFPPLRSFAPIVIFDDDVIRPIPGFTGRDDELDALTAALTREGIAAITGLGGTGKSSLAREFAWRNREQYGAVWWFNAENETGIIDGLVALGTLFAEGLDQRADRRAAAQQVIASVLGGLAKPALLIFDNFEDESLLRTWAPRSKSKVLITSRTATWPAEVAAVALSPWSLEEAVAYLQRESRRTDLAETEAQDLARALGFLPLALAHAAAYLRITRTVSARRYRERIADQMSRAPRNAEYPRSVFATFQAAAAEAERQATGAVALLAFAARFAPDALPDALFRQSLELYSDELRPVLPGEIEATDLRSAMQDEVQVDEALGALDRLSLLTFSAPAETHDMHRLVQLAIRDITASDAIAWTRCAIAVIGAVFPSPEFANWPQCERLMPHVRAALDALPRNAGFESAANLAHRAGRYLRDRGALAEAESLAERALAIREKALGPDHPDVALTLNGLASIYYDQGRYAETVSLFARTLAIQEKALGEEHADVALSLNNLGTAYCAQGRYKEAERLHSRALAIQEKTLGPDHPLVARSLNNLANVYEYEGRHAEVEPLHVRALAIREKTLGPDHPDVAFSLNNLAIVYGEHKRYAEAEPLFERALAIWEGTLGTEHAYVAHALNGLANLYRDQGRYAEAEQQQRRAIAIWEKSLGGRHADLAHGLNDLATLYERQQRSAEAQQLFERALAIREEALGPDHPLTQATRKALLELVTHCKRNPLPERPALLE